jgi:hypothetical protein
MIIVAKSQLLLSISSFFDKRFHGKKEELGSSGH